MDWYVYKSIALMLPTEAHDVFTIFQGSFSRLHLNISSSPAKSFCSHVGRYKVALAYSSWPTQEVCQAMGHAGCRVACPLLCCYTAFPNKQLKVIVSNSKSNLFLYYYCKQTWICLKDFYVHLSWFQNHSGLPLLLIVATFVLCFLARV